MSYVAVGASAGGLEAITAFIENAPTENGLTYLLLQHGNGSTSSHLAELLARHTSMPVSTIVSGEVPKSDHVYVIPSGREVSFEGDRLVLGDYPEAELPPQPIDHLFSSLAGLGAARLYAVVLSGTGRDGTRGLQALEDAGGLTFAQDPRSAGFPGMPESASASGLVDFVLEPEAIARKIAALDAQRRPGHLVPAGSDGSDDEIARHLEDVLDALNLGRHDFADYKRATLARRLARRVVILAPESLDAYIERLREDPEERDRLAGDFLIGVTAFFRDGQAHERVKALALRSLLTSDRSCFRVWSAGCSSGEELYSIVIAVEELRAETGDARPWTFFGTDVDPRALDQARHGLYGPGSVSRLSQERVERYFERVPGGFRIREDLRQTCIVAEHDLLSDPPFAHIDLVACRNVLIYLQPSAHRRVISNLHYALTPGGYLWLGPSEHPGRDHQLIDVDNSSRLFMRPSDTHGSAPVGPGPEDTPALASDQQPALARRPARMSAVAPSAPRPRASDSSFEDRPDLEKETEQLFLEREAPPFARLGEDDRVVYASEGMRDFLRPNRGTPSTGVDEYFVEALRTPLRRTVRSVRASGEAATLRDILVNQPDAPRFFDLRVSPIKGTRDLMIDLTEVRHRDQLPESFRFAHGSEADHEEELTQLRQELRNAEKSYAIARQQLRTSNEELLSMNEELHVANEELETSREELQSVNEELTASNAELTQRNSELARANSDFENLLESTAIPTLFLDRDGQLRQFTRQLTDLFSVQRQDIGRAIGDFAHVLDYPALREDHQEVQRTLAPRLRSVRRSDGEREYEVHVRPYRNGAGVIDGSVMTFRDITEERAREQHLQRALQSAYENNAMLEAFFDSAPLGLSVTDTEMRYLRINERLVEINGRSEEDTLGRTIAEVVPELYAARLQDALSALRETGRPVRNLKVIGSTAADPQRVRQWFVDYFPIRNEEGTIFAVGTIVQDVTETETLRDELVTSRNVLEQQQFAMARILEALPMGTAWLDAEGRVHGANEYLQTLLGAPVTPGTHIGALLATQDGKSLAERTAEVIATSEAQIEARLPLRVLSASGRALRYADMLIAPAPAADRGESGAVIALYDVTELVHARALSEQSEQRLRNILDGLNSHAALTTPGGRILEVNQSSLVDGGVRREQVMGEAFWDAPWWTGDPARAGIVREALEAAARGSITRTQVAARFADGSQRVIDFQAAPVFDAEGTVVQVVPSGVDIQDQLEAIAHRDALMVELQHRVVDIVATTEIVAQAVIEANSDPGELGSAVSARLACIARCCKALVHSEWTDVTLEQLLSLEASALLGTGDRRVGCEGDEVAFGPDTALFVSLGLRELVDQSRRNGALAAEDGRATLRATVRDGTLEELLWIERGEPGQRASPDSMDPICAVLLEEFMAPALRMATESSRDAAGWRFRFHRPAARSSGQRS